MLLSPARSTILSAVSTLDTTPPSHPHGFPAATSAPLSHPVTRPCQAASHALHPHLSASGSLFPFTSPWSEFLPCFFFSAAAALLLGHVSLRWPRVGPDTPPPHYPPSFISSSWLVFSLLSLASPSFSHSPSTSYLSSPGCCTYSLPNAVRPLIFTLTPAILLLIFS